jgi:hypothetical protein
VRQYFIAEMELLALTTVFVLADLMPRIVVLKWADAVEVIVATVRRDRMLPATEERLKTSDKNIGSASEECVQMTKRVINLLDKIEKRTKDSWRVTLRAVMGRDDCESATVESCVMLLKQGIPLGTVQAGSIGAGLEAILETLDVLDEDEAKARQAVREAREKEKAVKAAAELTGEAKYVRAIADFRGEVGTQCQILTKLVSQTVSQINAKMGAVEKLGSDFQFPEYPTALIQDLQEKLTASMKLGTEIGSQLDTVQLERDAAVLHLNKLGEDSKKLKADHDAALALIEHMQHADNWKERFGALVNRLAGHLASDNMMTLVTGVGNARIELTEAAKLLHETAAKQAGTAA